MERLQLTTHLTQYGELTVSLDELMLPELTSNDVLIEIHAAPINPSDMSFLFAQTNCLEATLSYDPTRPSVSIQLPESDMLRHQHRVNQSLAAGYEGAGIIIDVGASLSKDLIGRTLSCATGGMYATHKVLPLTDGILMPEGITPLQAASSFVNPMTVLAMLETVSANQHQAVVHTTGASSLGRMLIQACKMRSIPLINLVRRPDQVDALLQLGADCVLCSSSQDFSSELTSEISRFHATACFDAIGGGSLLSDVMTSMEHAFLSTQSSFSHYGSGVNKQAFVYGHLSDQPLQLRHQIGFSWSIHGWLLSDVLPTLPTDRIDAMKRQIQQEVLTTFSTNYHQAISLRDTLDPNCIREYATMRTGEKFVVVS